MTGFARTVLGTLALGLGFGFLACAQSSSGTSGTVRGSVLDPSGAAIKGASVEIQNPVAHYRRSTITDGQGTFEFDNIPYNNYHASAVATGFQSIEQDVDVRSPIPVQLKISLKIGTSTENVTVTAAADLVENDPTAHTDVDRGMFDKLALESQSSSLSSLVTLASPGVAADSNGLFMDWAITLPTRSRSMGSRLPTSKARSFQISFRPMQCSRWR
jgi:hypothetical protein